MSVIADTSVWSLFLRRRVGKESRPLTRFKELLERDEIELLGIIKQEILSGLKEPAQFERIEDVLSGFNVTLADSDDHTTAAEFNNTCRKRGIQGSAIDFLICAMASRRNWPILTVDDDFKSYAKKLPISLI